MDEQKLMRESHFCERVGISRVTAWRLRRAGRLSYCRIGKKIRYLPRHLEEFLSRRARMALNRKLTPLLAGRTIPAVSPSEKGVDITFSDGSVAHVKTAKSVSADPLLNHTVKKVRQQGDVIALDFEDGSSSEIKLAEATSSVMLRDRDNKLEYAD